MPNKSKLNAASATPHMDAVQAAFQKEVTEKGLTHVLSWMDSWYIQEAEAWLRDQVHQAEQAVGPGAWSSEHAMLEARYKLTQAVVLPHLFSCDPAHQSSQAGSTLRSRALVSACTKILRSCPPSIAHHTQEALWAEIKQLREANFVATAALPA